MKLFKKVAAAVLAGVMALSMVACGTTPVTPDTPDVPVDPTKPVEEQFISYLNYTIAAKVAGDTNKPTGLTVENELKDEALAVLQAIADGDVAYDAATGKISGYTVGVAPVGVKVYTCAKVASVDVVMGKSFAINAKKNDLEFNKTKAVALISGNAFTGDNWYKIQKTTTTLDSDKTGKVTYAVKANVQIGAASMTINGETCFVVVTKAV